MKIIKINHGIACRIGNKIYINKKLENYPKLNEAILRHEKEHSDNFNMNDIKIDLSISHLKGIKKEYYKFILQNPSSLTELLPISIYDKKIVFNPMLIVFWIFAGGMIWLILSSLK